MTFEWSNTMRESLRKKLVEKYPKIFSPDFIFEHRDGWFWLIDKLCDTLQFQTDHNKMPQIRATQVKEKFGTLRFYYEDMFEGTPERANGAIILAEALSGYICEECGASGAVIRNDRGWLSTKCIKCITCMESLDPTITRMVNEHFWELVPEEKEDSNE
jgi:hypothetical protein